MFDLYQSSPDESLRFVLGREGANKLIVIGLNPSTATLEKSDITATKVARVAANHGFDGFAIVNLYPWRSTDPQELPATARPELIAENAEKIARLARDSRTIWAAWGGGIRLRPYLAESLANIAAAIAPLEMQWVHLGTLRQDGHPRHPARLAYAWQFSAFDLPGYRQRLGTPSPASRGNAPRTSTKRPNPRQML